MIRVLEKPGIDFHLACEHRLQIIRHLVPGGNLLVALDELGIFRNDAQLLLSRKGFFTQFVPTLVELTFVLVRPVLGYMMGRVSCARSEIHKEGLVAAGQSFLLAHPTNRPIG